MLYLGLMGLVVVPLFLIVSARMVAQGTMKQDHPGAARFLEIFLYFLTAISLVSMIALIVYAINHN